MGSSHPLTHTNQFSSTTWVSCNSVHFWHCLEFVRACRLGAQSPTTALTSEASWRLWVVRYHAGGTSEHRGLTVTLACWADAFNFWKLLQTICALDTTQPFLFRVWQTPWVLQENDVPTTFSRGARHKPCFQNRERLLASKGFLCFSSAPPSSSLLLTNSWELLPRPRDLELSLPPCLYTCKASWSTRGWKLSSNSSYNYYAKCLEGLGFWKLKAFPLPYFLVKLLFPLIQ